MSASIPMKKIGVNEDIAYAALFFSSKEAGYITGQCIVVDGGQTLPEFDLKSHRERSEAYRRRDNVRDEGQ